jgi:hypothetical protein
MSISPRSASFAPICFPWGFYFYNRANGLSVADAQPNNILVATDGRLAPIDLVIGHPGPVLLGRLLVEPNYGPKPNVITLSIPVPPLAPRLLIVSPFHPVRLTWTIIGSPCSA